MDDKVKSGCVRICIAGLPFKNPDFECGQTYLTQYLEIISNTHNDIFVITGNYFPKKIPGNVKIINVKTFTIGKERESPVSQLFRLVSGQISISLELIKIRSKFDIYNIYMWTGAIIIPSIIARVLRKKIWLTITGSAFKSSQKMYSGILIFIPLLIGFIEETNYFLADKIILSGSDHMIQDLNLMKYQDKLFPNYYNFYIDTSKFSINTKIFERENIVGYVGRLSPEKGVREFIQAIVLLNSYRKDIKFLIVGDGPLMDECKFIIERSGCKDRVSFLGWVQHNEIKTYFNSMKIHVLPSSTEALGGTSLEAMACGAISIVNSVGGLEDTVEDGQTGFVLMNNSPETIAKKIIEVLDNKKLDLIQINARKYIVDNFSYDNVIHNWERLSEGERS